MRGGEFCNDTSGGLKIAPLVMAILRRVDIEGERPAELRRCSRAGQVLEVIVGHHLVALVPWPILLVLLQVIVDVPLRDVNDHLEQDKQNCQWNERDQVMAD